MPELEHFRFHLEKNLAELHRELRDGTYRHGSYCSFSVNDTKRRVIAVASIRDRFVHRLIYDHLVEIYDKTFVHDVWSCREGKGLLAAIERAQKFLAENRHGFFWRGDVRKFFDSVDHATLLHILDRRINDDVTMQLLKNDVILPCHRGLKFLGCMLYPTHRQLQKRVWNRVLVRMDRHNVSSYFGLVHVHCNTEAVRHFYWNTLKFLDE